MFRKLQSLKTELSQIIDNNPDLPKQTIVGLCDAENSLLSAIDQFDKVAHCNHPADKVRTMGQGWYWCLSCGERWKA